MAKIKGRRRRILIEKGDETEHTCLVWLVRPAWLANIIINKPWNHRPVAAKNRSDRRILHKNWVDWGSYWWLPIWWLGADLYRIQVEERGDLLDEAATAAAAVALLFAGCHRYDPCCCCCCFKLSFILLLLFSNPVATHTLLEKNRFRKPTNTLLTNAGCRECACVCVCVC